MSVVRGGGKMPKSKGARNSGASNEGVPMIGNHMLVNKPEYQSTISSKEECYTSTVSCIPLSITCMSPIK